MCNFRAMVSEAIQRSSPQSTIEPDYGRAGAAEPKKGHAMRLTQIAPVAGGFAVALVLARALLDSGDSALLPLLGVSMLLGASMSFLDYGFTGGYRALLVQGDGRALASSFSVPAVAALVIVPVAAASEAYARFVAPVGVSLVIGAAIFGVGMQITNGCGSGTLVAAGQGSRRMWVALPFFCGGGVIGSLLLPTALEFPSLGVIDLTAHFGPWGGLLATEALLAFGALLLLRGEKPPMRLLGAGALIGLIAAALFLISGLPWGITTGLTLWGAQAVQAVGGDLSGFIFWQADWARAALEGPIFALHGALTNVGLLLGAFLVAAARGRLRYGTAIGGRGALGAALGGLLMGIGARLSFGCNVGAFVGGVSSGSLHGFIWVLATLPGCWVGIRLRPLFGLSAR